MFDVDTDDGNEDRDAAVTKGCCKMGFVGSDLANWLLCRKNTTFPVGEVRLEAKADIDDPLEARKASAKEVLTNNNNKCSIRRQMMEQALPMDDNIFGWFVNDTAQKLSTIITI